MYPKWLILLVFANVVNLSCSKLIHDVTQVCDGVYIFPEKMKKEMVQPYILYPISDAPENYWLMSPKSDDPKPYFAVTKMALNDKSFAVLARLTDSVIEKAEVNFGQIQLASLPMFNFVLALTKKCIRTGESPSAPVTMDNSFIVADTQQIQAVIANGVIFDPLKAKAVLVPKDFLDGSPSKNESILVLFEF